MIPSRLAFLLAPLCLGSYGVIRILDGLDGSHGPGFAWTVGHLFFIAGLVFFAQAFRAMRTMAGRTWLGTAGFLAGIAGALAVGGQFVIDIVVGFMSADHDRMGTYFTRIQDVPGVEAAFYDFGPLLFFVGQLILVTELAVRRQVKPWAPVLVLIDTTLPFLDKDLIPLGAALLLISFAPLIRREPRRPASVAGKPNVVARAGS
jgi:hypothetical protein